MVRVSWVGIDVGKATLDVAILPGGRHFQVARTSEGISEMVAALLAVGAIGRVILEATAGYERIVLRALYDAGIPVVRIEPARARFFAKSLKLRAKNDRIDALMLARMAQKASPSERTWSPKPAPVVRLRAFVQRRSHLMDMAEAEKKRGTQTEDPEVQASVATVAAVLQAEIKRTEQLIDALIAQDEAISQRVEEMEAVRGVGRRTVTTLTAFLPELGRLNRGEIASRVGVAPFDRDSGGWQGPRFISGGRAVVRRALYTAALACIRFNPTLKSHDAALRARGKKAKVALVACMRKLVIHLNAVVRSTLQGQAPRAPSEEVAPG